MPWPVPKWLCAMITSDTQCPPLMAMLSSPVLMVLQAITPQNAMLFDPGSMPSVLRAKLGVSTSPRLLVQRDGVSSVTPQTMNPSPGALQVPSAGAEVSLTWNLGEL